MATKAEGIREQSAKYPRVENLMHNVNEETLMSEHRKQNRKKAVGVDGVSKDRYDENAEENIRELVKRMKKFQYKPLPVCPPRKNRQKTQVKNRMKRMTNMVLSCCIVPHLFHGSLDNEPLKV